MILIYGEHSSGKSTQALKLVKKSEKTLYLSLDSDRSVLRRIDDYTNIQPLTIKNCFIIDIELAILDFNNTSKYKTLVVDGINFINRVSPKDSIEKTIKGLEYLHFTYDLDVIATYNVLSSVDSMKKSVQSIFSDKKRWELFETKKKIKEKISYRDDEVRIENGVLIIP